jgi:hypothetical protein
MLAPRPTTGIICVEWIMTSGRKNKKKETKQTTDGSTRWVAGNCVTVNFRTPQGVPIPAAISIGGSVERERGAEIIRVYKRKERRRRRKGDSHYEKTTAEWNRKLFITPL